MSDRSKIEWTDASWNPVRARLKNANPERVGWHCAHVSEGCRHCYAETVNNRFGTKLPYAAHAQSRVEHFLDDKMLAAPLRWKRPRKIFVGSMTDIFGDWVSDDMLDRIFAVMALAEHHTFQVLTKRPQRMRAYLCGLYADRDDVSAGAMNERLSHIAVELSQSPCAGGWIEDRPAPIPNVWLGVSVEDQATADERIPLLLETPAAKRFVSYEPALGPVDFTHLDAEAAGSRTLFVVDALTGRHRDMGRPCADTARLDWIIAGGESGPAARPAHPDWFRSVRNQCAFAGVAFFFKQWGEWAPWAGKESDLCPGAPRGCQFAMNFAGQFEIVSHHEFAQLATKQRGWAGVHRAGKRDAGAMLDGREHKEWPR